MAKQLLAMMTGMDFYYYSCSVCQEIIVAIRTHNEPIQCSKKCKQYYELQQAKKSETQLKLN